MTINPKRRYLTSVIYQRIPFTLSRVDIFRSLSEREIEQIAAIPTVIQVQQDRVISRADPASPAAVLFLS